MTVRVAELPRVTAPVPRLRPFVPVKAKLPFQFWVLLLVRVILEPLVLLRLPPLMVSAPVPMAVELLSTKVPLLSVVPPE